MGVVKIEKGKHFIRKDEKLKELSIIVQGKVDIFTENDKFTLEAGNIIGLAACAGREYQCGYVATEEATLMTYPYEKIEDMEAIFKTQPKYVHVFTLAAIKQAAMILSHYRNKVMLAGRLYRLSVELYDNYKMLCRKYEFPEKEIEKLEQFEPLNQKHLLENWKIDYYQAFAKKDIKKLEAFYEDAKAMNVGEILLASEMIEKAVEQLEEIWNYLHEFRKVLLNEEKDDLFKRYFDLEIKIGKNNMANGADMDKLMAFIRESDLYDERIVKERFSEYEGYDFAAASKAASEQEDLLANGENCLDYILNYASWEKKEIEEVRRLIATYRDLPDIYSTEDHVRKLRKSLTKVYYEIYKAVMKRALTEAEFSPIIQMFVNFGFMDVSLAGEENANALYKLTQKLSLCNSDHVYTMFEWLRSVYEGKNEPSRNEFDLDYLGYLADMRRNGQITQKEQEEWKNDQWKKVEFEIENMFASSNRAVYGKISTFVPMLCGHDIINSAESMLVTAQKIDEVLESITKVDYAIFYRDITFSDPQHDITREFLKKEVLPNIILMPNAGSNAMMWQETAGGRRDSAARFLFPVLTASNIEDLMIDTAGRFRWEICRKEQGARWNDIRDLSLTSEYYDYVQYYRKNNELSPEAKEKIKNALWKAKNNYREVFVKDYQVWMRYEAKGSLRMNKVSRGILFRYCTFTKEIREGLKENPMYQELISKYEILQARKKRHVELFEEKYKKAGGEMTEELLANKEFYSL